jgi:hypothetical protein
LPQPRKEPPSGFGYPLGGVSSIHPRETLSAPHALGLHPSKFSSKALAERRFLAFHFRSYAFSRNLIGLEPALQRTDPKASAVPLNAPERISFGRGRYSLGYVDLLGILSSGSTRKASTPRMPLTGLGAPDLAARSSVPLRGSRTPAKRHLPLARAPAYLAFPTVHPPLLFDHRRPADYFFLLRAPPSYEGRAVSLCGGSTFS